MLTENDVYLFNEGTHLRLYDKLGAHPARLGNRDGVYFSVWAPNAEAVSVLGDFNYWQPGANEMKPIASSGVWEVFVPDVNTGDLYKYHIKSRANGYTVQKADPFAFAAELAPRTASRVADLSFEWSDHQWIQDREKRQNLKAPMSIYEVHLGSWMRVPEEGNRSMTYREIAEPLADYVTRLGFTHVEFLPLMEHPYYGSWGYQTTGYFAPTSRYGSPQDFMFLIDMLHRRGIGVILDWVPSHFATDEHGLAYFDGTHLYEHESPMQGYHPDWGSYIFNYGRNEVRSFLLSSAAFWLDKYHIDGLRVDAVASMLYLDYSRKAGEWIPNRYGGRENLDAIEFLRLLNVDLHREFEGVMVMAEESTAWPMVSKPTYVGGLGFSLKWDMGWMHDTLQYMQRDPFYRQYHQNEITFRMIYAYNENFVLPLSHDEVVHGKGSLIGKMPGDDWQKFANLRALFAYMYAQPGKKLLFMGGEFGQWSEWSHEESLQWHLTQWDTHSGLQSLLSRLNAIYRDEAALHEGDCDPGGYRWISAEDAAASVQSFERLAADGTSITAVFHFTPAVREGYRIGVDLPGTYHVLLNSDEAGFGGSGAGSMNVVVADEVPVHGRAYSVSLTLPPLGALFLKHEAAGGRELRAGAPIETSPETPLLSNPEPPESRTLDLS
ncbi:MAG: 1,4-alpha-glucan branching protein GlgB [Dehalococcoidia bacterium]